MKRASKIISSIVLLATCAGAGFQAGKFAGFKRGSEWALIQADMLAREAGVFMPVYMEGDTFRVVIKQPRGLYKRAWQLSDRHEGSRDILAAKFKSPPERGETGSGI